MMPSLSCTGTTLIFHYTQLKAEEKVAELSTTLVKAESEAKVEREKSHYLKSEKEDLETTKVSSEYKVRDLPWL